MKKLDQYKKLIVWQKAMSLVLDIYKITKKFPDDERFAIISQIRRSAVSIPSNIAEGAGRNTKKDFNNFLSHAQGSSCELETQLIISKELEYISESELTNLSSLIEEIQKMSVALQNSNSFAEKV